MKLSNNRLIVQLEAKKDVLNRSLHRANSALSTATDRVETLTRQIEVLNSALSGLRGVVDEPIMLIPAATAPLASVPAATPAAPADDYAPAKRNFDGDDATRPEGDWMKKLPGEPDYWYETYDEWKAERDRRATHWSGLQDAAYALKKAAADAVDPLKLWAAADDAWQRAEMRHQQSIRDYSGKVPHAPRPVRPAEASA